MTFVSINYAHRKAAVQKTSILRVRDDRLEHYGKRNHRDAALFLPAALGIWPGVADPAIYYPGRVEHPLGNNPFGPVGRCLYRSLYRILDRQKQKPQRTAYPVHEMGYTARYGFLLPHFFTDADGRKPA